jgi:hypothetical protein
MRIKIWASLNPQFPNRGPYKSLDTIESGKPYGMGEATHYGPVISFPPFADPDTDQSVIVQLDPATFGTLSAESVSEQPPASYDKISLFPITVDRLWIPGNEPPPDETSTILEEENLTVENVSSMIKPGAFSLWQRDCMLAKDTIDALQSVSFVSVRFWPS